LLIRNDKQYVGFVVVVVVAAVAAIVECNNEWRFEV